MVNLVVLNIRDRAGESLQQLQTNEMNFLDGEDCVFLEGFRRVSPPEKAWLLMGVLEQHPPTLTLARVAHKVSDQVEAKLGIMVGGGKSM